MWMMHQKGWSPFSLNSHDSSGLNGPLQVRLCSGAKIPNLKALPIKGTGELWKSTLANSLP